jgi:hypothetical protein
MWTTAEVCDMAAEHTEIAQTTRKITERMILGMGRRGETTALIGLLSVTQVQRSTRLRHAIVTGLNPRRMGRGIDDPTVRLALMDLVEHDRNRHVRSRATNALAAIGARADVPFFAKQLREGRTAVKMYAARGLGNTHANEAVTPLIEALGDRSGAVRAVAAEALAGIGDRTAVPAVEAALRRTWNPVWRKGIKGALRRFR